MTYLPPLNGGRVNVTIGSNTAGAGALISSGTMMLAGGNNITLSQNAGSGITFHGAAGGLTNINVSGSNSSSNMSAIKFSNSNGVSFGLTTGSIITASHNGITSQSVQTQSNVQALYDGANSISTGTVRFSNSNGLTFGINGQTITASHNGLTSQSVQTQSRFNMTLGGNSTSAGAGYIQISSGNMTLAGGNNITLSQDGNAVTIAGGAGGGGGGVALYDGVNSISSGTASFNDGNGVSFGFNGQTITASHNGITSQTNQTLGMFATGNTTQNTTATLDARSLTFNGLGAASMGYSNGSIQISAPATSSLVATGIVSISTNGSTISIGAPSAAGGTLSRFEYMEGLFTSLSTASQGALSLNHMYIPFNVSGSAMKIGGSLSAFTNTSATTASINISLWMGLYKLNGSTLSLASSGSANNGFQWQQSASTTANTSVNGMRQFTVPMNVNITPGEYWVGAVMSTATTYQGISYTIFGNNQIASAASSAILVPIGNHSTDTNAMRDVMLFQGIHKTATAAGPTTIVGSQINNYSAGYVQRANFYNVIFNATY